MRLAMSSCARFAALVFAVLATCALAGCYEVQEEVLRPGDAVRLPGLEGTYQVPGKPSTTTIELAGEGNDYRYTKVLEDGVTTESGPLRIMPIGGRLYAIQIKSTLGFGWDIHISEFVADGSGARYRFLYSDPPPEALAAQYGLRIVEGEMMQNPILVGDGANIRSFLQVHDNLPLTAEEDWWVRQ